MSLKQEVQRILEAHGLKPSKRRGQHFLINQKDLRDIAACVGIGRGETVVEVGAGVGNLTRELLSSGARVVAVEKDERLAKILDSSYGGKIGLRVQDVLKLDVQSLPSRYKLVGNIPYYLTAPLIRKFLTSAHPPERIVLTIQKEVGERIVAQPPRSSFLSMMVAVYGWAEIKKRIPAEHFWPAPKVDSVVILIEPQGSPDPSRERFVGFLKQAFRQPRKILLNNFASAGYSKLDAAEALKKLGFTEKTRAQELSLAHWRNLYKALTSQKVKPSRFNFLSYPR